MKTNREKMDFINITFCLAIKFRNFSLADEVYELGADINFTFFCGLIDLYSTALAWNCSLLSENCFCTATDDEETIK